MVAEVNLPTVERVSRDRERAFFHKFMFLFFLLKLSQIPGARFSALLLLCHVDEFCAKLPTLQNGDIVAWPAARVWPMVAHPFGRWQPVLLAAGSKLLGAAEGGPCPPGRGARRPILRELYF
jgi:hypothetical protein